MAPVRPNHATLGAPTPAPAPAPEEKHKMALAPTPGQIMRLRALRLKQASLQGVDLRT